MSQDAIYDRICPDCGSLVRRDAERCWLCGVVMPDDDEFLSYGPSTRRYRFDLSTIFFIITFVAVAFGATMLLPGLGILLLILFGPAMARLIVMSNRRVTRGEPLSFYEKAGVFGATVGLTLITLGALAVALFVICLAILGVLGIH